LVSASWGFNWMFNFATTDHTRGFGI
jgi:hypothetical protein